MKYQPTPHHVEIGRLTKKLNKMRDQRDKARADLEHYKRIISIQPYLETRYKTYEDRMAERRRIEELETRVQEQARLIQILQYQNKDPYAPPYVVTC